MTNENNNNNNNNSSSNSNSPIGNINSNVFTTQTWDGNLIANIVQITNVTSNVGSMQVIEGNVDANTLINNPEFTNVTYTNTFVNGNVSIVDTQGFTANGNVATQSQFNTIDPTLDPQITQNLVETVEAYYNDETHTETATVMAEIRDYASKIQCEDFHGKGTIDDYSELFRAAAKIANESKQIKLDVDVSGFNEFAQAADDLSNLFNSFILKLQNVSIINDLDFLRSISIALRKIWNLSETFGKFKQTILATSSIHIPQSAHNTSVILQGVLSEVNCAMNYINHFVSPGNEVLPAANLSAAEHDVIDRAVATIDNWNVLCDQGVSIAMSSNPDIQLITATNNELRTKSANLRNATSSLRAKLALYNINRNVNVNISG
jgi:hypothetical protein